MQIPGKLFEYIAIGKPVIGLTGKGATADFIQDEHLGFCVDPDDIVGIENVIQTIVLDDLGQKKVNISGLDFKERYESLALTRSLVEIFNKYAEVA